MKKSIKFKRAVIFFIGITLLFSTIQTKNVKAFTSNAPYVGQIQLFALTFAPAGWVKCDGQSLQISQHEALFALIGNKFGGDAVNNFNLPNLTNASPCDDVDYYICLDGLFPISSGGAYDGYMGEIAMFPYDFAPGGWAKCDGQTLPIAQNSALFSLLGTKFGGDGNSNFKIPKLTHSSPLAGMDYYISLTGMYPSQDPGYSSAANGGLIGSIDLYPNNNVATNKAGYCNGQILNISGNIALFSLIGNIFGGNAVDNFGLPDLTGASPDPNLKYYIHTDGMFPSRQ